MSQRATASEGLPGEPIMWTLIGGEVLVFGAAPTGFLDARDAIAAAAAPALAGLAAAAWRRGSMRRWRRLRSRCLRSG